MKNFHLRNQKLGKQKNKEMNETTAGDFTLVPLIFKYPLKMLQTLFPGKSGVAPEKMF